VIDQFSLVINRFSLVINRFSLVVDQFSLVINRFSLVINQFSRAITGLAPAIVNSSRVRTGSFVGWVALRAELIFRASEEGRYPGKIARSHGNQ
jgi:hypothetical protein